MEHERTRPRNTQADAETEVMAGDGLETILAQQILTEADRILDSIKPVNAEQYLQQNRQRGGQ